MQEMGFGTFAENGAGKFGYTISIGSPLRESLSELGTVNLFTKEKKGTFGV